LSPQREHVGVSCIWTIAGKSQIQPFWGHCSLSCLFQTSFRSKVCPHPSVHLYFPDSCDNEGTVLLRRRHLREFCFIQRVAWSKISLLQATTSSKLGGRGDGRWESTACPKSAPDAETDVFRNSSNAIFIISVVNGVKLARDMMSILEGNPPCFSHISANSSAFGSDAWGSRFRLLGVSNSPPPWENP